MLLSSLASNYKNGNDHFKLAAVVEFIHSATLLHDDVVDDSMLRRGRATANKIFGNSATVLVGDFLYSRAFQLVSEVKNFEVTLELSTATNIIAEGEIRQLINLNDPEITEETYYKIVRSKTSQLFQTAGRLGAILGAPKDMEMWDALGKFGMHIGTAFQLIDDALDYSGDINKIGKNLGDDFSQGKVTLPLIHVLREGSCSDVELVRSAIKNSSSSNLDRIIKVLQSYDAIGHTRAVAKEEVKKAVCALDMLRDSKYKRCLRDLAEFSVSRKH